MEKKKIQAMKKASEVPAGPGIDTCSVQHLSENDLLSKRRGLRGEWGWDSGGKGSPLPTLVSGRAFNSARGRRLNWRIIWPSKAPQICYGFAAQQQECLIYNR